MIYSSTLNIKVYERDIPITCILETRKLSANEPSQSLKVKTVPISYFKVSMGQEPRCSCFQVFKAEIKEVVDSLFLWRQNYRKIPTPGFLGCRENLFPWMCVTEVPTALLASDLGKNCLLGLDTESSLKAL